MIKATIIILVCLVFSMINLWSLLKQVTLPIKKTVAMLEEIYRGEGDLTSRLEVISRDEAGELMNSFNIFKDNITNIIKEIKNDATRINVVSNTLTESYVKNLSLLKGVNSTLQEMTLGTNRQTEDIVSINSNVIGFGEKLNTAVRSVGDIDLSTIILNDLVKVSEGQVILLSESINKIGYSVSAVTAQIGELSGKINDINSVTDAVSRVTEETKLLSLNAAIEAASVGELGRGFAVVAQEIRKLSDQSKNALKNISDLVAEVFSKSHDVRDISTNVNESIHRQIKTIDESMSSLRNMIEGINIIIPQVKNIHLVMEELNDNKKRILDKLSDFTAFSEQSTAANQEIAASSNQITEILEGTVDEIRNLNGLVLNMNSIVNRFKVS